MDTYSTFRSVALDIFGGTGFIGSTYVDLFGGDVVPRDYVLAKSGEILYFISTTSNYNVLTDARIDVETNLSLLMEILQKNKDTLKCVNFISSWFVYGENSNCGLEGIECRPKGFYSITKKCAEDLLISFCKTFGIKYRILRLCNVYGPGDKFSKEKNALQWLAQRIKNNEDIELYHNGEFTRCYMHVEDVCRAINCVISTESTLNDITNISWQACLFRTIIDYLIEITGSTSKITSVEPTDFHKLVQSRDCILHYEKLRNLGFKPKFSMEEGLRCISQ
jgi:nucleoside-diphosphate-sugar epimerase